MTLLKLKRSEIFNNVSPFDLLTQFAPNIKCDYLEMDCCDQDRPNWIKDKLTHCLAQQRSDSMRPAQPLPKVCLQLIENYPM